MILNELLCPLCGSNEYNLKLEKNFNLTPWTKNSDDFHLYSYFSCLCCDGIFVDPKNRLSFDIQATVYKTHQNNLESKQYQEYILTCIRPLDSRLKSNMIGVDFGSGPSSILKQELAKKEIAVFEYDPIFHPSLNLHAVDFVACIESLEHFHSVSDELDSMIRLLKREGLVLIKSQFHTTANDFKDWYYHRDPTHIFFWSPNTVAYISENWNLSVEYSDSFNTVIFKKTD